MRPPIDLSTLHAALAARPLFSNLAPEALERLPDKGLAHDHVRIKPLGESDRRLVVRLPRLSQFGLDPATNLAYQAACFARAGPCGHTPRLVDRLEPNEALPMGALVVDEILGGSVDLPRDLAGMAECFARVHLLDVPVPAKRPPLADHADPLAGVMGFIEAQAPFIEASMAGAEAAAMLREEIAWARGFAADRHGAHPPARLCLTDTHPGNFMVDARGKVFFTDLEKALYGSPAIDLGHATVLTSTFWDLDVQVALSRDAIRNFYAAYLGFLPADMAEAIRPWLLPMRRLAWLRSTTWSCKWYAERHRDQPAETGLRARVRAHVSRRLSAFVDVETIEQVRAEWRGPSPLVLE